MHRLLLVSLLLLTGCAGNGYLPGRPISTFTLADVQSAAALAKAGGDANGATCFAAMAPVAAAVQQGQAIGLATMTELYRVALLGAQGPCASVVLPIIIKLGPALGLASAALPGL